VKRYAISVLVVVVVLFSGFMLLGGHQIIIAPASSLAQEQVQNTLVPRFINFDIGAVTLRSGAVHQDASSIPDLPPYVELPNTGSPLMMVNFTMPPDYASGGDVTARLVWDPRDTNCFYVLRTELVGYGPGNTGLFDSYWREETDPNDTEIIEIGDSADRDELFITFQPLGNFLAQDGDAMTLTLWRLADDVNDTCSEELLVRSIAVVYQGHTAYLPWTVK